MTEPHLPMDLESFEQELAFLAASSRHFTSAINRGIIHSLWAEYQKLNLYVWREIVRQVARTTDKIPASWINRFRGCADSVFQRRRDARTDLADAMTVLFPYRDVDGKTRYETQSKPMTREESDAWCLGAIPKLSAMAARKIINQGEYYKLKWSEPVMASLLQKSGEDGKDEI